MTFKKIDDFKRRDELVQEHLRLKDELKDRFISIILIYKIVIVMFISFIHIINFTNKLTTFI